jgi:hypothetical protein
MPDADDSVATKQPLSPIPPYLSEGMKVSRMLEVLEQLHFNSHNQTKVVLDRGVRDYLVRAIRKPR